jgi:hypothetical protein
VAARFPAQLVSFIRLGRPVFLTGGFVLYGLGAALAVLAGATFDGGRYAWGQLAPSPPPSS